MPQIEQLQVVHWGPLRPDPIEFTREGINVATGPNGSGKTCLLDAAKLILGVEADDLKQRPADYIFDGGGDATRRADRAYVKAIFANPERPGRAGRVFADAGRGCEMTDHVTAICEVTRDKRRYTILPGAITWGEDGRRLEDELKTLEALGRTQWFGPRRWADLLAAAGVSRALLGVISVRQGETDRTLDGRPEDLLRRMLELTGKQQTLDDFRSARAKLAKAKADYGEVAERFQSERRQLDALTRLAARHEEFVAQEDRLRQIDAVELPTAERRQREVDLDTTRRDRDARLELLQRTREDITGLDEEIPRRDTDLAALQTEAVEARDAERRAQNVANEAATASGAAQTTLQHYEDELAAAQALLSPESELSEEHADAAAETARSAEAAHAAAQATAVHLEAEREELRAGRPARPAGLDAFREALHAAGIGSELVAERLEVGATVPAEAVLHDGVWALVVAPADLEAAVALAREHRHGLPLAAAAAGSPTGVFADAGAFPDALGYLEARDLPVVDAGPGVDAVGVVRGRTWAAVRARPQPVLGSKAREERLAQVEAELAELVAALPELAAVARTRRQEAETLAVGLRAATAVGEARQLWLDAENVRAGAVDELGAAADAVAALLPKLGEDESELRRLRGEREGLDKLRAERERDWEGAERRVAALEAEVAAIRLTEEQHALGDLPTIEALRHELDLVVRALAGFSEEERSELVLAEREEQAQIVAEVEELLSGRREDLERVESEVETARERYDTHIRQTVHALARAFREVCAQAGMEGDMQLVPATGDGEAALDVRVAHQPGEPKRSYRSGAHSGGEKAKISLLLLLAAMSVDGAADLLIVDEHSAHLDSRNIDAVGELMDALKSRVQFILATPTNAEAGRLTWCDEQLAFFPRPAGEPYAPPIRLFTRLPEPERATGGAQLAVDGNGASA